MVKRLEKMHPHLKAKSAQCVDTGKKGHVNTNLDTRGANAQAIDLVKNSKRSVTIRENLYYV